MPVILRHTWKAVQSGRDRALVGQVARHPSLILALGLADEGGMVNQAVFRGVSSGLERAEERLLRAENLHCGRREFGQICQASRVRNQTRSNLQKNWLLHVP